VVVVDHRGVVERVLAGQHRPRPLAVELARPRTDQHGRDRVAGAAFRDKLDRYARYRRQMTDTGEVAAQHEIDRVLAGLRGVPDDSLPKGLDAGTLDRVLAALRAAAGDSGVSAAEMAERIGMSRVTARRYLEHLAEAGRVARHPRYGGPGRPEVEYRPA
jgi:response regulator of citrate/malate metabolism